MLYSQHFTCHWKLLVIYVMWLMFNKMADAERSAAEKFIQFRMRFPLNHARTKQWCPFRTTLDLQHQVVFQVLSLY